MYPSWGNNGQAISISGLLSGQPVVEAAAQRQFFGTTVKHVWTIAADELKNMEHVEFKHETCGFNMF